jgi:hypothetical protein
MIKATSFQLISLFLMVSLMAPSMLTIFDAKGEIFINFNLDEEEEREQSEIKYDEANLNTEKYKDTLFHLQIRSDYFCHDYLQLASILPDGIELPPPEQNI